MLSILPPWDLIVEFDQLLLHAVCQRTCLYVNGNHVRKLGSVNEGRGIGDGPCEINGLTNTRCQRHAVSYDDGRNEACNKKM